MDIDLRQFITRYGIDGKIVIGVSGGADSMCLAHVLAAVIDKAHLYAVTVNHNLRQNGASDADFVMTAMHRAGIACQRIDIDVAGYAATNHKSIETAARILRHKAIAEIADSLGANYIALAHNSDDQVESILMHILRGTGIDGLRGMGHVDGKIIRPLLDYSKSDILTYIQNNHIPYVTDETNADVAFRRNFIRHEILPLIRSRYDGVDNALLRLSDNARETMSLVRSLIDESKIRVDGDRVHLHISALNGNASLAREYIVRALAAIGQTVDVERNHIKRVISLTYLNSGARVDVVGGVVAVRQYDDVVFVRDLSHNDDQTPFVIGKSMIAGTNLKVETCTAQPIRGRLIIDVDKVPQGAVWRTRREGDIFIKFDGSKKKLKEYLIDKKIPSLVRDKLPLLCYNEHVLAIAGVEISNNLAIDSSTVRAAEIIVGRATRHD